MTFAPHDILRRLRPSTPKPAADYQTLLGAKLRLFFDTRRGAEFWPGAQLNPTWRSHEAAVGGITVRGATAESSPLAWVDPGNFGGRIVIRIAPTFSRKMVSGNIPNVVPVGTRPEVFMVARPATLVAAGIVCGLTDSLADFQAGAWFSSFGGAFTGCAGAGRDVNPFSVPSTPRLFTADLGEDLRTRVRVNNVVVATAAVANGAVVSPTTQAAVGGFTSGDTSSADWYIAQWGVVSPPMTDAERARMLEIARHEWAF